MAISRSFNGATIYKPGAYSRTKVNLSGGFPIAATGVVAIIGEATGGAPGSSDGVQTFTSEDIAALITKYKSGPIVDAARILISPARDPRVANGASMIKVYKTNASTAATLALANAAPVTLYNVTSKNFGSDENLISVKIEAGSNPNARIITVQKGATKEVLSENAYEAQMVLTYTGAGTAALLTISPTTITVTVTGAPLDNLSISLAGKTIQDVVDIIDNHANYTATTTVKYANAKPATNLDPITTPIDLITAKTLRAAQKEILDIIAAESSLISATRVSGIEGQAAVIARTFLANGALGASTNSTFQAGFDALLATRCNIVVPLVAQDASAMISSGQTDPASTFTNDAVNLQAVTHCITASNTKNRSERNCYVAKKSSFAAAQSAAQDLASERASMLFQNVEVLNASGDLATLDPWAASCVVAGIQAGTDPGTPSTFKIINVNSISHQDYNSKTQVDLAIKAGLTPLEALDTGGFRVVVGNTTYGVDANFVFNRVSVVEAADTVAYNLRQQLEAIFTGDKARTGTAQAIKNSVIAIMSTFLRAELIVGDDTNDKLGWKDLTVVVNGNTAEIDITITPVQGIDFILASITLDNIKQSA